MDIRDIMSRLGGIPLRVNKANGTIDAEDLASLGPAMDRVLERMGVEPATREAKKAHVAALLSRPGGVEDTITSMELAARLDAFAKLFEQLKDDLDSFVAKVSERPGASPKLVVDLGESAGMLTIAAGIISTSSNFIQHAMTRGCNGDKHAKESKPEATA